MYIGIDVGGTNTRIAGSPSLDNIKLTDEIIFPTIQNFEEGIVEIAKRIREITDTPKGIGIGLPGNISEDGQSLKGSNNLGGWVNKPIMQTLNNEFECPVYLENDAVAQAYGEAQLRPEKRFIYLVWGTGVGGSLVSYEDGKVRSTKLGRNYLGTWEEKYGGKNLEVRFGKLAKKMSDDEWDGVMKDFKESLLTLSKQLDVDTIVIGGGVVSKQEDRILKVINSLAAPQVYISQHNESLGVYGAISLIKVRENSDKKNS